MRNNNTIMIILIDFQNIENIATKNLLQQFKRSRKN